MHSPTPAGIHRRSVTPCPRRYRRPQRTRNVPPFGAQAEAVVGDGRAKPVHKLAERRLRAAHDGSKNLVDRQLHRQGLDERRGEEEVVRGNRWRRGRPRRNPERRGWAGDNASVSASSFLSNRARGVKKELASLRPSVPPFSILPTHFVDAPRRVCRRHHRPSREWAWRARRSTRAAWLTRFRTESKPVRRRRQPGGPGHSPSKCCDSRFRRSGRTQTRNPRMSIGYWNSSPIHCEATRPRQAWTANPPAQSPGGMG